jgi:Integrase core domain
MHAHEHMDASCSHYVGKPKAARHRVWLTVQKIETTPIDPGKPWQKATNESFIGKFPDERLSMERFDIAATRPANQETKP